MTANELIPDNLSAAIKSGNERLSEDLHMALPGRIEKYDKTTRLATVQPLIMRRYYAKDEPELLPQISNVPIRQQRTKLAAVHIPPKKGDFVELIFADRSLENWLKGDGEPREPLDLRKHHLSDAWAILDGGTPSSGMAVPSNPDNVVIKHGSCEIHIEQSGLIHLGSQSAADFVALAGKVDAELAKIAAALTAVSAGGGVFTGVNPYTTPLPVGATKTKAD